MGPTRLGERKKLGSSEMVVKKEERGAKGEEEGEEEEEWEILDGTLAVYKIHSIATVCMHI